MSVAVPRPTLLALLLSAFAFSYPAVPALAWDGFRAGIDDGAVCRRALGQAARRHGVPRGWALAIGLTEAGRRRHDGSTAIWPWTLNIAGAGGYYQTRQAAFDALQAALDAGETSIDIGCAQINWHWHRDTAAMDAGDLLDPRANADYAMRFLAKLKRRHGDWRAAVAHFHSGDPALGQAYLYRVGVNRDRLVGLGRSEVSGAAAPGRAGRIALWSRLEHMAFTLPDHTAIGAAPSQK